MHEVTDNPRPWMERFIDRAIGTLSPRMLARREGYRFAADRYRLLSRRLHTFSSSASVNSRMDRTPKGRVSHTADGWKSLNETYADELADRALNLCEDNPIADGLRIRLVERIIGPGIRSVPRTDSKPWNKKHQALWEQWRDECDVRGMSDWYGLQGQIVDQQVTQNRCGVLLRDDGRLQIIEGTRLVTPPEGSGSDRFVNGVEFDELGRPARFWVVNDPDSIKPQNFIGIDARNFVYFPLRWRHGDSVGRNVFGTSFINFEQVDAIVEGVSSAVQMASNFGLLIREVDSDTHIGSTIAGTNSQGDPARMFNLEPAMVKWIGASDGVEQVKPEHPQQNLGEFLREVVRLAGLPSGIPLEILLQDYSALTFHGGRAMFQALDMFCDFYRAHQLYTGFRRIYRWRTSKWIKEGLLGERQDAWRHRFVTPPRLVAEEDRKEKADQMAMDAGRKSYTSSAEERYMTRDEMLDEWEDDEKELKRRGLQRVYSNLTRDRGAPQANGGNGANEDGNANGG